MGNRARSSSVSDPDLGSGFFDSLSSPSFFIFLVSPADGVNLTQWFSSLEQFTGQFYKRYPEVELSPMLSFVIHSLTIKWMNWVS